MALSGHEKGAPMYRAAEPFTIPGPAGVLAGWTMGQPTGEQAPILFIHPINLQGSCWKEVCGQLSRRRLCLMPDLRGHGSSSAAGPYGIDEWSDDCLAVLDHFGVERAHIVGGSLGGPLAVNLAATAPERVVSISAIGSALTIRGEDVSAVLDVIAEKGVRGMFREVIPRISVAPHTPEAVIERILEAANPNDGETVAAIWGATIAADVTDAADAVACPAQVITGEHDVTCTPEQGEEMARRLRTKLVTMPGVGHLPMYEAPDVLARLVAENLESAEPAQ